MSRCLERGSSPSRSTTRTRIVYEKLLDLYNRQAPIEVSVVAEELKTARQLDQVGGYAFLAQVSSRIRRRRRQANSSRKVREQALQREIIARDGRGGGLLRLLRGIDEFVDQIEQRFSA